MNFLKFAIVSDPQEYTIVGTHKILISLFKGGYIIEYNNNKTTQGELYDVERDKNYIGLVKKSTASIFEFSKTWPFIRKSYSLSKNTPLTSFKVKML